MYTTPVPWGISTQYPSWGRYAAPNRPAETLRIVYYNDIHEKFEAYPRLKTAFDYYGGQGYSQGKDVLKLCGGDWNIGREARELELNVLLNNLIGLVASAPGNHEYDAGIKALADALKHAQYDTIATNLHIPPSSALYQRYLDQKLLTGPRIYITPSGQRYGLVGVSVPNTHKYLNPDMDMEGVATQNLENSIKRVQGDINQLRRAGINRIIMVSHSGYKEDLEIARRTSGVDVIVGGHSHTELPGIVPQKNYVSAADGHPVVIVQAGMNGLFGILDVMWDAQGRVIPLEHTIKDSRYYPQHPAAAALIDQYLGRAEVLGFIAQEVHHKNAGAGGENAGANKVADAMQWAINRYDKDGVDITMFRGTELRNDIHLGPFTDRDLRILLPFTDKLMKFKMTGREIMDALNESGRCLREHEIHPGIMHTAGLRYTVDKRSGKVVNVMEYDREDKRWEPLELDKTYTVATGEFQWKNKKEYQAFNDATILRRYPFSLRDAFGDYVKAHGGKPVTFSLDGRLKVIGESGNVSFQAQRPAPTFSRYA